MALPILDGNQSATTLSTILAGGEHTPAHTVVSLGSTAISNITSAISGSVVSISNFPTTQTIAGTVTANVADPSNVIQSGVEAGILAYAADLANDPLPISGAVTANVPITTIGDGIGSYVSDYGNFPISGTVTANLADVVANDLYNANSSVRIMGSGNDGVILQGIDAVLSPANIFEGGAIPVMGRDNEPLPISGTVTANIFSNVGDASVFLANPDNDTLVGASNPLPVAGSVSLGNISPDGGQTFKNFLSVKVDSDYYQVGLDRIVPEVSVTNLVNTGSLTSRSGTPTTANSVFATTCVTNGQRKYLLIQNVTTGGNVITVGVGLFPTTTRGIQLVAGAGITFESSFIPTGAVYVLSSVTASNFTILEGQ
jgi:hypothetical protein